MNFIYRSGDAYQRNKLWIGPWWQPSAQMSLKFIFPSLLSLSFSLYFIFFSPALSLSDDDCWILLLLLATISVFWLRLQDRQKDRGKKRQRDSGKDFIFLTFRFAWLHRGFTKQLFGYLWSALCRWLHRYNSLFHNIKKDIVWILKIWPLQASIWVKLIRFISFFKPKPFYRYYE